MTEKRLPLLWNDRLVGHVDELDDDSTIYGNLSNCKIYARWHPADVEVTKLFLYTLWKYREAKVEVDGTTYHVYDTPGPDIKLQRLGQNRAR